MLWCRIERSFGSAAVGEKPGLSLGKACMFYCVKEWSLGNVAMSQESGLPLGQETMFLRC